MLQALLAGGAVFQGLKAEIAVRARRTAFMLVFALLALIFLLVGLLAFAVAAAVALEPTLGTAGAIAAVGGGAVMIAVALLLIGTRKDTATAAATAQPTAAVGSPFPGLANATGQAPVPWLVGALALGLLLGRKS